MKVVNMKGEPVMDNQPTGHDEFFLSALEAFKNWAEFSLAKRTEMQNTRINYNGKVYSVPAFIVLIRSELNKIEACARVRC